MGNVIHVEQHNTGPVNLDLTYAPKSGSFALRNVLYQADTDDTPTVYLTVLVRGVEFVIDTAAAVPQRYAFPNAAHPQPIYLEAGSLIRFYTTGIANDVHHVVMTFTEET